MKDIVLIEGDYTDTLDRRSLGSFALPAEVLNSVHRAVFASKISSPLVGVLELSLMYRDLKYALDKYGVDMIAARGELFYWWIKSSDGHMSYQGRNADPDAYVVMEKLRVVAEADEVTREFYRHDIWDVDFIAQCRSDGVDPAMARSILSGAV